MVRKARKVARKPARKVITSKTAPKIDAELEKKRKSLGRHHLFPSEIPPGKAYQWVDADPSNMMMEMCLESGWKPVPAKRHPHFHLKGNVVVDGLALMEISQAKASEQIGDFRARAQAQMDEAKEPFSSSVRFKSESIIISSEYENVPDSAPDLFVPVVVNVRMSAYHQQAAAVLHLPVQEYARRRIALYGDRRLSGIILPCGSSHDGLKDFELHETGDFTLARKEEF